LAFSEKTNTFAGPAEWPDFNWYEADMATDEDIEAVGHFPFLH
jgi:hypothetical protein